MTNKEKELILKIKALADKGIEGEKENAQKILNSLLKKYNITVESLETEELHWCKFDVTKVERRLLDQIAYSVTADFDLSIVNGITYLELTKAQEVEVRFKFSFYNNLYKKELELFYHAFIHKNDIYNKDPKNTVDPNEFTEEEKERRRRVKEMSKGIERGQLLRQLNK